jgi:hypothetical protein
MEMLMAMGGIGTEPVGQGEGEEKGETVVVVTQLQNLSHFSRTEDQMYIT